MAIRKLAIQEFYAYGDQTYRGFDGTVHEGKHGFWSNRVKQYAELQAAWDGKYEPQPGERLSDETTYAGAVLRAYETTERIMSDVWESGLTAEVWDAGEQRVKKVLVGIYYGSTSKFEAVVDATPEAIAAAAAWNAEQERAERQQREAARLAEIAREAARPARGKTVKVVRGRKVPLGTTGVCFWEGVDAYRKAKLGIATSDRKVNGRHADVVWTAASNCEVVAAN